MTRSAAWRIFNRDGLIKTGAVGDVVISLYTGNATPDDFQRHWDSYKRAVREADDGMWVLAVLEEGAAKLMPESRKKAMEMSHAVNPHTRAAATVLLGTGFVASFQRSIIVTFNMITRPKHESRVFGDLGAGAQWLLTEYPGSLSHQYLVNCVNELRDLDSDAIETAG